MKKLLIYTSALFLGMTMTADNTLITEKMLAEYGFGKKKFKDAPKKVYIHNFRVNHQLAASAIQSNATGSAKTAMAVVLDGVDAQKLQEITDRAYQRMISKLKEAGLELITAEQAAGIETFEEWEKQSGGTPSSAQLIGYLTTTPAGMDYFVKSVSKKGKERKAFLDKVPGISSELDGALVFDGNFNFQFAVLDGSSSYLVNSSKMKADIGFILPVSAIAQSRGGAFGSKVQTLPTYAKLASRQGGNKNTAMIQYTPKKDIEIEGVVETKKLKEYTANPNRPYTNEASLGIVVEKETRRSHAVPADAESYYQKTEQALNDYLDVLLGKVMEELD